MIKYFLSDEDRRLLQPVHDWFQAAIEIYANEIVGHPLSKSTVGIPSHVYAPGETGPMLPEGVQVNGVNILIARDHVMHLVPKGAKLSAKEAAQVAQAEIAVAHSIRKVAEKAKADRERIRILKAEFKNNKEPWLKQFCLRNQHSKKIKPTRSAPLTILFKAQENCVPV